MSLFKGLTQDQELVIAAMLFGLSRTNTHIAKVTGYTTAEVRELLYRIRLNCHKIDSEKVTSLYHKSVEVQAERKDSRQ